MEMLNAAVVRSDWLAIPAGCMIVCSFINFKTNSTTAILIKKIRTKPAEHLYMYDTLTHATGNLT
jgi:hypothetical protein